MKPVETANTIKIEIEEKPIAGMFYIRDKYLKRAKATGKRLVLEYQGEKYTATYKEWMAGAKRMEKEFLIPGSPMILFGNYIKKFPYKENIKDLSAINHLMNMPDIYRDRIKAMLDP